MMANAILAMAVSEAYSSKDVANNFYLKFILWSVAAVAFFRSLGSSAFGVINIVHAIGDGRVRFTMSWLRMPKWLSGPSSKLSSKLSSIGGSSLGSTLGSSLGKG
jgi:chitin synthase